MIRFVAILFTALFLTTACGNKGSLYLPTEQPESQPESTNN